jgi:hypothetical protein
LVSTAGAFFAFFGVVPDSGTTAGDVQSLSTAGVTGPCKVSYASTTTVAVAPCTAYSGGRKVVVAQTTVTLNTMAANNWQHICLTGTNSQPASSTGNASETANLGTVSFASATGPIVCLADVKDSGATGITAIYDTRVYTTTTKEFGYAAAALPIGVMVKPDSNTVQNSTTTSGYALTAAGSATLYANLGVAETSFSACSASASTCNESLLTVLDIK